MSPNLQDRPHDVQRTVRTRPLFTMRLDTKLDASKNLANSLPF